MTLNEKVALLGLVALIILFLGGCATFDDKVEDMRTEAEQCQGLVVLNVAIDGDRERVSFKCKWENEEAEY